MIDPRILDLNPAFLLAREVAPLRVDTGRLVLGMRNPGDGEAVAAVRLATRLEVEPVPLDEREWSEWRQALAELCASASSPHAAFAGVVAKPTVLIRLGERSVQVLTAPDPEDRFLADDDAGWLRLAGHGRGGRVLVILLSEATMEIAVADASGEALALAAPLQVASAVWSAPVSDGRALRLSLVRKDWFEARITAIRRAISPAVLTIVDEAGRPYDDRPGRLRRLSHTTLAIGAIIAAVAGFAGYWHGSRTLDAIAYHAPQIARTPIKPTPLTLPPETARAPSPQVDQTADTFELVGVVGRLPDDAVALVRPAWGRTMTLRLGDSLLGWRMSTITADSVTLTKGAASRRLTVQSAPER